MAGPPIPFFTDQCVPDSAGDFLLSAGHELTRLRDVMATDTADPIIAVACSQTGHVLVSHDGDFRDLSKRLQISQREYRTKLHRILLKCSEPRAAARMEEAINLIEHEWQLITPDRPMVIEVREQAIVTFR